MYIDDMHAHAAFKPTAAPGTIEHAEEYQAHMASDQPHEGETPEQAIARRDYYRGWKDGETPLY